MSRPLDEFFEEEPGDKDDEAFWRRVFRAGGLFFVIIAMLIVIGLAFLSTGSGGEATVATLTGHQGSGSAQVERVTPLGTPADESSGPTAEEAHQAAAAGLAVGQGAGGVGNPLNPQLPQQSQRQAPSHTDTAPPDPQVIIVPQDPGHAPPPCDPHDPSSSCYEPPCDPSDPHGPCYEPPPYQHNDECDPDSYYYDPSAICL